MAIIGIYFFVMLVISVITIPQLIYKLKFKNNYIREIYANFNPYEKDIILKNVFSLVSRERNEALEKIRLSQNTLFLPLLKYSIAKNNYECNMPGFVYSTLLNFSTIERNIYPELYKINKENKINFLQLYCVKCNKRPQSHKIGHENIVICPTCHSSQSFIKNAETVVAWLQSPPAQIAKNSYYVQVWDEKQTPLPWDWDLLYIKPSTNLNMDWALNAIANYLLDKKLRKNFIVDPEVNLHPNTTKLLQKVGNIYSPPSFELFLENPLWYRTYSINGIV